MQRLDKNEWRIRICFVAFGFIGNRLVSHEFLGLGILSMLCNTNIITQYLRDIAEFGVSMHRHTQTMLGELKQLYIIRTCGTLPQLGQLK